MFEELLTPKRNGDSFVLALPTGESLSFTARRGSSATGGGPGIVGLGGGRRADAPARRGRRRGGGGAGARSRPVDHRQRGGGAVEHAAVGLVPVAWGRSSSELADLDPLVVEGEMRGHPWIVANKAAWASTPSSCWPTLPSPPAQSPCRGWRLAPTWPTPRRRPRQRDGREGPGRRRRMADTESHRRSRRPRTRPGRLPPRPPVAVRNRIVPIHAGDIARQAIVPLGPGPCLYLPQQSLRTFVDIDDPDRRWMKLPLSILNTSVYQGLPRARTVVAPALTQGSSPPPPPTRSWSRPASCCWARWPV